MVLPILWGSALKQFSEFTVVTLCLWLNTTELMNPNKDETAVHGCSSYLHCSYSGEVVVRMRVGSGQTMELGTGGLFILRFTYHYTVFAVQYLYFKI